MMKYSLHSLQYCHYFLLLLLSQIIIMQSERAIFSLNGTNVTMPNRYKIHKYKVCKMKSQKPEQIQEQICPFIVQSKQAFPKAVKLNLNPHHLFLSNHLPDQAAKQNTVNLIPKSQNFITTSNSRLNRDRQFTTSILKKGKNHYNSMKHKRCTCGDCAECLKDFTYFLQLFSNDQSIPQISAKSWCIWKRRNDKYLYYYGKRIHTVREIASLTKMVTAMTAVDFLQKYGWQPHQISFMVNKTSTLIRGTTANLVQGQICNILDLLYGMMLPSGNDAAIALSEAVGLIMYLKGRNKQVNPLTDDWYVPYIGKNFSLTFIGMMNQKCSRIGTVDTKMFNCHGNDAYEQLKNVSTCNQLGRISSEFVSYPFLRNIVKTSRYGPYQNTNKLLEDGFEGIKTGITDTAGPCLSAFYKDYIIVVLHSKSMNERWIQVKKLVKWILRKG